MRGSLAVSGNGGGVGRVFDVLEVRLVDQEERVWRDLPHGGHELFDRRGGVHAAGRIVRIADEEHAGAGGLGGHRGQVHRAGRGDRHVDHGRAAHARGASRRFERRRRADQRLGRAGEGARRRAENLTRAWRDQDPVARDAVYFREPRRQFGDGRAGIAVRLGAARLNRGERGRTESVRVLVRANADRLAGDGRDGGGIHELRRRGRLRCLRGEGPTSREARTERCRNGGPSKLSPGHSTNVRLLHAGCVL